jgi:hypothetical protein
MHLRLGLAATHSNRQKPAARLARERKSDYSCHSKEKTHGHPRPQDPARACNGWRGADQGHPACRCTALVGNSEPHRQQWLGSFNRAFNQTPREAIETVDGLTRVVRYLDGARAVA